MGRKEMVMTKRRARYERMGYRFVGPGKHSAIKVCKWSKDSLRGTGACYKETFYGIACHRCLQMTPVFFHCSQNCGFCWRPLRYALPASQEWDSPKEIMDGAIEAQREVLQGFKGNTKTGLKKFREAELPKHVAISLAGEPTLYPKLGELIEDIHSREMTSFLVTNGTYPERLLALLDRQPTQLYVTLGAPDKSILQRTCKPILKDSWERLQESLGLLNRFKRSVIRLTLVKNLNLVKPEEYARLVEKSGPDFLEVKAFVNVGGARERLPYEDMPRFPEIQEFAEKIERASNYRIEDVKKDSRVVLLVNESSSKRWLDL